MEVFVIPHGERHLVYFPFQHTVFLGNAALVDLVGRASAGEAGAHEHLTRLLGSQLPMGLDGDRPPGLGERRANTPFLPTRMTLLLTEDCTMRCRYCYANGGKSSRSMPWGTIAGVIDCLFDNAVALHRDRVSVTFHGGDVSAVWPLFVATREYLHSKEQALGIRVETSLGTNGLLDPEQRSWLTRHIDGATLSLDGPPDIHDALRRTPAGAGTSEVVMATVAHFDNVGFRYGIRTTITAASVTRLEEVVEYLCEHTQATHLQMEPLYPHGRGSGADVPSPGAFVEGFRRARDIALRHHRRLSYSGARLEVLTDVFCKACGDSCVVTPTGELTSCYEVADASDPRSELFFFGRYDAATRRLLLDEDRLHRLATLAVTSRAECQDCFCKWHCAGDCPAKVAARQPTEDGEMPPRCLINRELTKDQLVATLADGEGTTS
jgi:uncharacterized protein